MQIEIRGRNTTVTEAIRKQVDDHFGKIAKQVSDLARLEVELMEERNPAIANGKIAEVTLHVKGSILRAREASPDLMQSIDVCAGKLARQVKRYREKRSRRRDQQARPAA